MFVGSVNALFNYFILAKYILAGNVKQILQVTSKSVLGC
jgi:hypothetical protein